MIFCWGFLSYAFSFPCILNWHRPSLELQRNKIEGLAGGCAVFLFAVTHSHPHRISSYLPSSYSSVLLLPASSLSCLFFFFINLLLLCPASPTTLHIPFLLYSFCSLCLSFWLSLSLCLCGPLQILERTSAQFNSSQPWSPGAPRRSMCDSSTETARRKRQVSSAYTCVCLASVWAPSDWKSSFHSGSTHHHL